MKFGFKSKKKKFLFLLQYLCLKRLNLWNLSKNFTDIENKIIDELMLDNYYFICCLILKKLVTMKFIKKQLIFIL